METNPLGSLSEYSRYIVEVLNRSSVKYSTVKTWSTSPYTGIAEGEVYFVNDIRLRLREELDFNDNLITAYGYEIYQKGKKLYWYDDFPHPHDPNLASTFPHHKHVEPNIKNNRAPAPGISFKKPNIQQIIEEIEKFIER